MIPDDTREELLDLIDKLDERIGLVNTYIEHHDGINDSTYHAIDRLFVEVYNTLADLKELAKFS
ncbi:hypothetical protein AB0Y20_00700 [Heyndrickxia oleronia]|uniref:hypothetical protein n=1 Tax=Heyndrickxia oleronia TaxID=38875 RepID=UPI003F24E1E4